MTQAEPSSQNAAAPRSLLDRLGASGRARAAALRARLAEPPSNRRPEPAREWRLAAALAALIAAGPVATIAGAHLLAHDVRADATQLERAAAPQMAERRATREDRAQLAGLAGRPTLGSTLEAFARVLPADAALVRLERGPGGLLEADVSTPDPDALRAALRRDPALAALRDLRQQQGDAVMIVSLAERPQ